MANSDTVFSVCGMCPEHCHIEVESRHSRPWWVHGNRTADPRGAVCLLGALGPSLARDASGPTTPLIREGARGGGLWRSAGWDEALDYACQGLRGSLAAGGPDSVAWVGWDDPFADLPRALLRGLGSSRYHAQHGRAWQAQNKASLECTGLPAADWICDYARSRRVVFQGRNVFEPLSLNEANAVLDAMASGCRITAVDVRATQTACKADVFLMIKPGSDYALNLAVLHVLLFERLFNAAFVGEHMPGVEALAQGVREYIPEWAQEETGIAAQDIRTLARELAQAAPAVIWQPRMTANCGADAYAVARSAYLINGLLGAFGAPGGLVRANGPEDVGRRQLRRLASLYPLPKAPRRGLKKSLPLHDDPGHGADPLAGVKAVLAHRHVPALGRAAAEASKRRLDGLDCIVSITSTWSDAAWNADVVLPEAGYLSNSSILATRKGLIPQFFLQNEATLPEGGSRPLWRIVCGLAEKLGLTKLAFRGIEDIRTWQLAGTGVKLDDFKEKGFVDLAGRPAPRSPFPLPTATGELEALGERCPALPEYAAPAPGLRLFLGRLGWRDQGHCLDAASPGPFAESRIWLHEDAARDLGLAQGDLARLSVAGHAVTGTAYVSRLIHPRAVFFSMGPGGRPSNANGDGKGAQRNLADWLDGFIPGQPGAEPLVDLTKATT